jgi:hypothetical protein
MRAADLLARLQEHGYAVTFERGQLMVRGPAAPRPELERAIVENRDSLAARVLLSDPSAWLRQLFDLYWSGHETPVRLTAPSGKAEVFMVSVSIKNICAAVAAEIGAPVLEWERLRAEVEEALGSWEGAA